MTKVLMLVKRKRDEGKSLLWRRLDCHNENNGMTSLEFRLRGSNAHLNIGLFLRLSG